MLGNLAYMSIRKVKAMDPSTPMSGHYVSQMHLGWAQLTFLIGYEERWRQIAKPHLGLTFLGDRQKSRPCNLGVRRAPRVPGNGETKLSTKHRVVIYAEISIIRDGALKNELSTSTIESVSCAICSSSNL
jgi:hypothetical protein